MNYTLKNRNRREAHARFRNSDGRAAAQASRNGRRLRDGKFGAASPAIYNFLVQGTTGSERLAKSDKMDEEQFWKAVNGNG